MIGATRRRLLGGAGAALAAAVAAGGCRAGQAGAGPADPAEARAMDVLRQMERRRGIGVSREDGELLLLIKTSRERWPALATRVRELHPFEVPELLAFDAADGSADYLAWLDAQTREA